MHIIILILLIVSTAASVSSASPLLFRRNSPLQLCARGIISQLCCCVAQTWTVGGDMSKDLWYRCLTTNGGYHCKQASNEGWAVRLSTLMFQAFRASKFLLCACLPDWIQAVQALMILSVLFCFFSLIAFLYQLFRLVKGGRFFFTAIFQILASEYPPPPKTSSSPPPSPSSPSL